MTLKTKFMMGASDVEVVKMNDETALDYLPAGIYQVKYNDLAGFYLGRLNSALALPEKIYGSVYQRVQKCIDTYKTRSASTGILLTGDKGTGKTLMMSVLASEVMTQLNLPVILVQQGYAGASFTTFVQNIGECAMVFDEFGKMYSANNRGDDTPQKELLSLMDGIDKTKRMFIMTENSELDVNEFMLNRPSRIYYHFRYKKLDEDSIIGYCQDKNVEANNMNDVIDTARRSRIFSFDMLQTIVEEHLRYGSSIKETIEDLNIDLKENQQPMMEVLKVIRKETEEECELYGTDHTYPIPEYHTYIKLVGPGMNPKIQRQLAKLPKELREQLEDDLEDHYEEICIDNSDLAYQKGDQRIYESEDFRVIAKDLPMKTYTYWSSF